METLSSDSLELFPDNESIEYHFELCKIKFLIIITMVTIPSTFFIF
jgi:hypothetical protein